MKFRRLAIAASILLLSASAAASQTVGFAEAIKLLAASCGKDIQAHCQSASLANNGITACLEKNQSKISQKCNADRVVVIGLIQARLAAQAEVAQICNRDMAQYCKGVKPGAGHMLRCLLKAQPSVSSKCNSAIDLAGYR
ncbi:hypothetical protein [Roseibium sp. M-1]